MFLHDDDDDNNEDDLASTIARPFLRNRRANNGWIYMCMNIAFVKQFSRLFNQPSTL